MTEHDLTFVKFAVNERPMCVWSVDQADENLMFLRGIDPEYYFRLTSVHDSTRNIDSPQRAATSLRVAYGMALETLFAMIGATVQAPECPLGWLSSYKYDELRQVVAKIHDCTLRYARAEFRPVSWQRVSDVVHRPCCVREDLGGQRVVDFFAQWWKRLASDFLSEEQSKEFNSLKHGFRVMPGSLKVRIGDDADTFLEFEAPTAHTFLTLERMQPKHHYCWHHHNTPLQPGKLQAALAVVGGSVANIAAYLRARSGDTGKVGIKVPTDLEAYDRAWTEGGPPISHLSYGGSIQIDSDCCFTDEQILSVYDQ